jgi:hypothetical protein
MQIALYCNLMRPVGCKEMGIITLVPVENEREYSSWECCLKREKVVMASARRSYVAYE